MLRAVSPRLILSFIAFISGSACTQTESITDPGLEISAARSVAGPSYVAQEVGYLSGDVESAAHGVNDLGYVVGVSFPPSSASPWHPRAFLRVGSNMIELSSRGFARAVSNGSTIYIAGESYLGENTPTRWTYNPSTGSVGEEIIAPFGRVQDINDAGTIIGTVGGQATLWEVGGTTITIPPVSGFTACSGKAINNAGYYTLSCSGSSSRGFLIANGHTIELTPATGHTMSFAGEVSELQGTQVYVSGISATNVETGYHLARWTVNIANGTITRVEARKEVSEGRGVSDGGVVPGQTETKGNSSVIAWTLTGTTALKPTKGGSLAEAQDISASGQYIAGSAAYQGFSSRGLLWTRTQ